MKPYSTLKWKKILSYTTMQMNLEYIILSERFQSQKDKYCLIPLIWGIQSNQIHRNRKENGGYQGLEKGEKSSRLMDIQFHISNSGDPFHNNEYVEPYRTVRIKMVKLINFVFHHNKKMV